jgi:hypothetical protein
MNLINILSVLGLFMASFLGYLRAYYGNAPVPSHFPFFVTYIMIAVFAISYVLSLWNVSGGIAKLLGLLSAGLGLLIAGLFSVLILMGKASYPYMFNLPACYIQALLLLVLVLLWNKKK